MGMFDNLEVETDIEVQEDKVGGGGFAKVDHTGYYGFTIEKAYAGQSPIKENGDGGAYFVTIKMKSDEGAFFDVTEYITSGNKKGCKNYYFDKENNKQYLPGYNKIKALDSLLGGSDAYPKTEKKQIMLWDRDAEKELPVEKEVITGWFGKKVGGLVMKILEDKYRNPSETVEKYEMQHFLEYDTGRTRNEITLGTSGFKDKWLTANPEDKVYDKREVSKGSGSAGAGGSNSTTADDGQPNPFA